MDVRLLLAVLILSILSVTSGHVFSCEEVPYDTCSCSGHSHTLFELICPQLQVQVQINLMNSVQLQCSNSDTLGFSTLSGLHIGDVERFILRLCPLPDMSMRELMTKMGINRIEMLQIQSYNNLNDALKKKHFEKLFEVTRLSLNNNGLTSLPRDIFEDMGNLTWLDMKYNYIDLPKEVFYFTPHLEVLELGMNNLTHLKPGIFKNLDRLRLLNLWSNRLTNLTRSVFSDVPNLESLDLNTNHMENIRPDLFADLIKLKRLNLYGNRFISLPQGLLSGNIYLEEFQMHENNRSLIKLPPGFLSNLINLKMVRLSGSKIMLVPEDAFSGSKNIANLYLNRNFLTTLPNNTFADLEALEFLDLSVNIIKYLPENLFYNTSSLKVLKLDFNNIMEIPPRLFWKLKKLEYLDLRFNKIKLITGDQFFNLGSLRTLNISDNQLNTLGLEYNINDLGSYSVFLKNTQLEDLQLANNSLTEIYLDWKLLLQKLRFMNLSFNRFQSLKTVDLEFNGDIFVDLSNNNISWVNFWDIKLIVAGIDGFNSSYDRDHKTRQKTIKLDSNPFECDCQLLPFVQFLHNDLSPEVQYLYNIPSANLKCKNPKNLEKMSLSYVPYNLLICEFENSNSYICPENCGCQYRAVDKGNIINCQSAGLRQIPSSLPVYKNANHTELYLERNQLTDINIPLNKGYENVTHFYLADNNISRINTTGLSRDLKVLDVCNNNMTYLNKEAIHFLEDAANLESLLLIGNPWLCDCDAEELSSFLKKNYNLIKHLNNVTCTDGRSLADMDRSKLCPNSDIVLLLTQIGGLLGILAAILAILYCRYQTEIHIYCFSSKWKVLRWLVSRPDVDENKTYDAFISYAHEDESFVTQHLVPYLEESEQTHFKLCLHYRDWVPGESIHLQILNSVQNSRRTIVVLSPNFLGSVWGKVEFRAAHQQALEDGQARVIAILYEDVGPISALDKDLRLYLQTNTYVKWGSPWFWQQLNYALPHPVSNSDDINCIIPCLRKKSNSKANNILQSVQITNHELHFMGEKEAKDSGCIINLSTDSKPHPLIIEEVDSKQKPSSENYQNGKAPVCA